MNHLLFSGPYIDRDSSIRPDESALRAALNHPNTRFVLIWQGRCMIHEERLALLTRDQVADHEAISGNRSYLGRYENHPVFALEVTGAEPPAVQRPNETGASFAGLRELSSTLPERQAGLAALARALVLWQNRHRYCGVCGAMNRAVEGGYVMACSDSDCGQRSFPRLDPAIIVLVQRDDVALLGRQASWPERRFSTIAGFVEPGESLEDTLRREVAEETNIRVGAATYRASQPWPFPSALMIGFHAEGLTTDIRLNDGELAEARWVSRRDMTGGDIILPPKMSVAYHLIEAWFDQYDGPALATFGLPDSPLRIRRT